MLDVDVSRKVEAEDIDPLSGQLDPNSRTDFTVYTFTITTASGATTTGGQALSVRVAGGGAPAYSAGKEYWNVTQDLLDAFSSGGATITVAGTSADWSQGAPPGWQGSTSSPQLPGSVSWVLGDPPTGSLYTSAVALKVAGSVTSPQVSWGLLAPAPPSTGTYAIHPSGATFNGSAPSPLGKQWYKPG